MIVREVIQLRLIIVVFLSMGYNISTFATHLMGGSVSFQYIGQSGSSYIYDVKIEMYRDCSHIVPPNTQAVPFDASIELGVYNNNATRSLYSTETFTLTTETVVDPPKAAPTCKYSPAICIHQGVYEKQISLPYSSVGYHLLHQRCCRNAQNNIVSGTNMDEGETYYAFIPPTDFYDSSPYFSGIPTPYFCSGDSIQLSYAASDPDGDSLEYNLVIPWQGGTDNNPIPVPSNNLILPLQNVVYSGSYSFTSPFGSGGMVLIDHATGLVTVRCPLEGLFALAVECNEYRNGQLLSSVRRDIELIVLNCPPNNTPVLSIPGNKTIYNIEAGDVLKFSVTYNDPDGDSVFLTRTGNIFGPPVPMPYAILPQDSGLANISSTFIWQTACDQANKNPYFFTVKARDNGCPVKTEINILEINVQPFKGPDSISGPKSVCNLDNKVMYRVYGLEAGCKYNWIVSGGIITSRKDTSIVEVTWDSSGNDKIQVTEFSKFGCGTVIVTLNVVVHPLPVAEAGIDRVICSGDTINTGSTPADSSCSYLWSPPDNLSDTISSSPLFSLKNIGTKPVIKKYKLKVTNKNNCFNYDSVQITVNPQYDTFSISGNITPCYNGIFVYNAPVHAGSTFQWFITGGSQVSGGNSNSISVHWTDSARGKIMVLETNLYGCRGDTSKLLINIVLPIIKIFGPQVVCPNSVKIDYWVNFRAGSIYNWHVDNGKLVTLNSTPAIQVNWGDSGTAMIWTYEITKEGCKSDTAFFPVLISYHLKTSEIFGDTFVCENSKAVPYYVYNSNGSTYFWTLKGDDAFTNNGKNKVFVNWGSSGTGHLAVLEMSYDSVNHKVCIGDTVNQPVIINPVPTTSPIRGPLELCEKNSGTYSVTGFNNSVFNWNISPPVKFNGQNKNTITAFWDTAGTYKLSVIELSIDSCLGPLIDTSIVIHPNPVGKKIIGDTIVCYPNNNNISYNISGFSTSHFDWQVIGGNIVSGANTNHISVDWIQVPQGFLSVKETTLYGCEGNTIIQNAIIDSLGTDIEKVSTIIENDKEISIDWAILNSKYFNKNIRLFKTINGSEVWNLIDSFPKNISDYLDTVVATGEYSYYYKTSLKDLCGDMFESPVHRSILLKGSLTGEFDISLNWNTYIGWKDGVDHYDIYRKVNNETEYTFYRNAGNDSNIILTVGTEGFIQYYRIVAVKSGDENVQSWSNEISFKFPPMIFVPNSFSPNGDGINDVFTPVSANLTEYNMIIFDRWGEIIFVSNDVNKGWDGTYKGQYCQTGVYGVTITYKGNSPQKSYVGTITLLR